MIQERIKFSKEQKELLCEMYEDNHFMNCLSNAERMAVIHSASQLSNTYNEVRRPYLNSARDKWANWKSTNKL